MRSNSSSMALWWAVLLAGPGGGGRCLEQPDDGLGQQAEHQAVHIGDAGGALPDEVFNKVFIFWS